MNRPPWLGRLPTGWNATPLRHVAIVQNSNVDKKSYEDGIPVHLCNYTDVYYNEYIRPGMDLMKATATAKEVAKFELRSGDVIITKDSESWDDIAVPACVPQDMPGVVCGYHLTMLRPGTSMDGRFLLRALQSGGVKEQFWLAANGVTRFGIGQQGMKDALIPAPPLPVQRTIADFLDRKTAAIDALIEKKERLLTLLAEKQDALIHRAVTKGLDSDVPMKDSGVQWIGEIPAHWEVTRLKFLVTESVAGPYGSSLTKAMYSPEGYRVYGQQQVIPDDFEVGDYYISEKKFASMTRYEVHPGDLLVSVMGTVGKVAVVPDGVERGIINPRLVRYKPDDSVIHARFLQLFMLSDAGQAPLLEAAQGSTMDGLNMAILGNLSVVLPPLEEQRAINDEARAMAGRVEQMTYRLSTQIDRLREYRQALITAAVTGQLDIQGAV